MRTLGTVVAVAVFVTSAAAQQFNRPTASMVIDGNNGPAFPMTINARTTTTSTIALSGGALMPFVFARSGNQALQPTAGVFGGDLLDIPLTPAYQILADGYVNGAYRLNGAGTYSIVTVVPGVGVPPAGIAVGYHDSFQSLVVDPTALAGYHLTAATRVNVIAGPAVTNINLGDENQLTITLPAGMTLPFYGTAYTAMTVGSNGYMYAGTGGGNEYYAGLYDIQTGPPRLFGFFSDLDTATSGTERYLIDTNIPGSPGLKTFKMEYNGVGDYAVPGYTHTFSLFMDNTGYIELAYGLNCAQSVYDTMVGITPGVNCLTPNSNLLTVVTTGGAFGGPAQAFWDWFGNPAANAYYPQPWPLHVFSLAGTTLHFQPTGTGTVTQSTSQYHLY